MKRFIAVLAVLFCATILSLDASDKEKNKNSNVDDYNLKKAYEVLQESNDVDKALSLVEEQLKTTPNSIDALFLRMRIYTQKGDYGLALSDVNRMIKLNKPKKTQFNNSTLHWWKATIYEVLEDTEQAVLELKTALVMAKKEKSDNIQDISFALANDLYALDKYDEADAVYCQMLKEDETDVAALVGLARSENKRGNYESAIKLCDRAQKLEGDYSGAYKFRMQAYDAIGKTDKAIDDAIEYLDKDSEDPFSVVMDILLKRKSYSVAKIKEKRLTATDNSTWDMALAYIYEQTCEYEKAIAVYDEMEEEYGKHEIIYCQRARCYSELGFVQTAVDQAKLAIDLNPDASNYGSLGDIYRGAGMYDEAVEAYDNLIELQPTFAYGYYAKGWCYELAGDDRKAMELYNDGIDIDREGYAYIYLMRGEQYMKYGEPEKAKADFETVLQIDTLAENGSCRQYALLFLGNEEAAQEWMEKIIEAEPENEGHWYDQACLYSRMGRLDDAVKALEKAFEMGYCNFAHIEHDDDVDPVRARDDFKAIIAKYEAKLESRIAGLREKTGEKQEAKEAIITEIPITRHSGGTFDVPCTVNGLALNMIFDTGASDVTISSVEAGFMLKNNYLSEKDIKGKSYYQIADGSISEGTVINLREVRIGDAVLTNVKASVVNSQYAPILLGESVLARFGTFTIDNINSKLVIKQ